MGCLLQQLLEPGERQGGKDRRRQRALLHAVGLGARIMVPVGLKGPGNSGSGQPRRLDLLPLLPSFFVVSTDLSERQRTPKIEKARFAQGFAGIFVPG